MPSLYEKLQYLIDHSDNFMPSDKRDLDTIVEYVGEVVDHPTDEEMKDFLPPWRVRFIEGKYKGLVN